MMVHNLASNLQSMGHRIILFAPNYDEEFIELKTYYALYRFKGEEHLKKLFLQYNEVFNFDLIFVQGAFKPTSMALELSKEVGSIPVVVRTHGEDIQIDEEAKYGYRRDPNSTK